MPKSGKGSSACEGKKNLITIERKKEIVAKYEAGIKVVDIVRE